MPSGASPQRDPRGHIEIVTGTKLRVALAGAGMISYNHLVAWQRQPSVEVVAICDPKESRAQKRCTEFGIAGAFTSFEQMLEHVRPDAVDVAAPIEAHGALVTAAMSIGIDTLCQKPLCPTLCEAEALLVGVTGKARLMVHENWRFRPWFRIVSGWLASRRIGTVRQARLSVLGSGLIPDEHGGLPVVTRQPYMGNIKRLIVAEVLIHHLDVLRWLFGPLRVGAAAIAHGSKEVQGESCATAMMIDRAGAAVIIEGSMMAHGYPPRPQDRLEVLGDDGRILFEKESLILEGARPERHSFDLAEGYQASFDGAIAHFIECLGNGREFETSAEDNLDTLRLVEAIYARAEEADW